MKSLIRFFGSPLAAIFRSVPQLIAQPSLWPDRPRKSWLRRYLENLRIRFADHGICQEYNAFGLDLKESPPWQDFVTNMWREHHIHSPALRKWNGIDYTALLDDKALFALFFSAQGIPVVQVVATYDPLLGGVTLSRSLLRLPAFFMKPAGGICGQGGRKIAVRDGTFQEHGKPFDLAAFLRDAKERWVFQHVIVNHPDLTALNPDTLNTVRMMTCWNRRTRQAELWGDSALRVGRKGEAVDNFHAGGIAIGIDASGRLKREGISFRANLCQALYTRHPDSGLVFEGRQIPFYHEAVEMVLSAQRALPQILSVGWDVAITPNGPVLMEGNYDWDVCLPEIVNHTPMMARCREIYEGLL